jgi:arylsulfatase A
VSHGIAGTVDILPTVAALAGADLPAKPVDGIDIWPLLSGRTRQLDREVLLYFDNWNVQCARWKQWKLHFSRYNSDAYNPAPAIGRVNLALAAPELYDLEQDPNESYDAAPEHPEIVAEIRLRVDRLIDGFPEEVRKAYADTKARQVVPTPVGALPRPAN